MCDRFSACVLACLKPTNQLGHVTPADVNVPGDDRETVHDGRRIGHRPRVVQDRTDRRAPSGQRMPILRRRW